MYLIFSKWQTKKDRTKTNWQYNQVRV